MSEAAAQSGFRPGTGIARVLSDDRLAERAVKGDERAFAAIFRRYHQSLYRFCLAIVGNSEDAQDALQNTMVKVLRALPGEERRIELKPWLYRIAHNESIELIRRRRETGQLDAELVAAGSDLAEEAAVRERLRRLISDLGELPERQRGALVMRELSGLDFAEIGDALGTSPAVVRQTLYEARLSLRQMDEGRAMSCEAVTRALSDGDGRVTRRRDVRAHLRGCASCRAFREEIDGRRRDLAALSPLPAVAAAGLLSGLLGGGGNGAGGGLAAALGGGAAKSIGASAALKGAATVAVVAAIGVGAANRGGLIDVGLPGSRSGATPVAEPEPAQGAGAGSGGGSAPAAGSPASGSTAGSEAGGAGHLGASRAAKAAAKRGTHRDPKSSAESIAPQTGQGGSTAHARGNGHAKQLPAASAHGQQTAAAHKAVKHASAAHGHRAHPLKPSHPAHPAKPSSTKDSSSPPPGGDGQAADPAASTAPKGAGSESAPAGRETGTEP